MSRLFFTDLNQLFHSLTVAFPEMTRHLTLREEFERAHPYTMQTHVDASGCVNPNKGDPLCQALDQAAVGERHLQAEERPPHSRGGRAQGSSTVGTLAAAEGASCCLAAVGETAPPQSVGRSLSQHYEGCLSTCVLTPKKRNSSNKT